MACESTSTKCFKRTDGEGQSCGPFHSHNNHGGQLWKCTLSVSLTVLG